MHSAPSWKEFAEYTKIHREDLCEEDWDELFAYTELLNERCNEYFDLEEHPIFTKQEIDLKSFVGSYEFESGNGITIKYRLDKLSEKDFSVIARDIAEWGVMLGSPFLRALLRICSPLTEKYEIILAYSDLLRRYTETALAEYIPPIIEKRQYVAEIPLGKILVPKTVSLMATGQMLYVSQRVKANIINLPLLLMIRFHAEMVRELASIEKTFEKYGELPPIQPTRAISRCKGYHRNFLAPEFRQKLLTLACDVDFTSCAVLDKIHKQASSSPSISDISVLWEAFIGRRTLLSKVKKALMAGYALKPVCKLYELWCLKIVLDLLKEFLGDYKPPKTLPGRFVFRSKGMRAEVLYNKSPKKSLIVKKLREVGVGVSTRKRPDFTISFTDSSGKKITLVLDAKYRLIGGIGDDDLNRLFRYMVDYNELSEEHKLEGIFLHVEKTREIHLKGERTNPKIAVHLLSLKPESVSKSKESLRKIFGNILESF